MDRFWEVAKVLERCDYWSPFIGRGLHAGWHASEDDFCEVKRFVFRVASAVDGEKLSIPGAVWHNYVRFRCANLLQILAMCDTQEHISRIPFERLWATIPIW
jgi:hypothetical protein